MEAEFYVALKSWDDLQNQIIPDRLTHAKIRKHTRHWEGEGKGTKALDPRYAVDMDRWVNDLMQSMNPLMERTARRVIQRTAKEMEQTGIARAMHAIGRGNPRARTATTRVFGSTRTVDSAVSDLLMPLRGVIRDAAKRHAQRVMDTISDMEVQGASISQIQRAVRREIGTRAEWRKQLARYLTTAITEGAKEAAYQQAGDLVVKRWNTREDERVRPTHRRLNGREIQAGKRFRVGKYWMTRPLDPAGGIEEVVNCRCWLDYDINPRRAHLYDRYA